MWQAEQRLEGLQPFACLRHLSHRGHLRPAANRAASEGKLADQQALVQTARDSEARDVALAIEGDKQAFERLYRVHVARVHGLTRRMAGHEAAEDLTQDVFVRAWEKLPSFRGDSQFGTWLYRLAVNLVVETWRKKSNQARRNEQDDEALARLSVEPADSAFAMDFQAAVNRLPDAARMVFMLHDVDGYKHREISKLLGITSGTSKGQLHRARSILRRHLGARAPGRADERR